MCGASPPPCGVIGFMREPDSGIRRLTMNLAELLAKEAVLPHLTATTRKDVLQELLSPVLAAKPDLKDLDILSALCRREEMGSTSVGDGVALPHCRTSGLSRITLAAGRSLKGIAFGQSPGDEICRLFFLILAPENEAGQHLRVLAQLARRAKDPIFRSDLLLAETSEHMWRVITAP